MKRFLALVIAAVGVLAAHAQAPEESTHVIVQAHRGYSEVYPENTLIAIEKAFEVGADRVETDLALTQDGHVVLMHDRTVDRTTDGSGRVQFMTLAEVKALDAGAWKGARFAGERVPTLEEALELARGKGELNLEIKVTGSAGSYVAETIRRAVEIVQEHEAHDYVIFSSFDFEALQQVQRLDPELRVLLLDWDAGADIQSLRSTCGYSRSSVYHWLRAYQEDRLDIFPKQILPEASDLEVSAAEVRSGQPVRTGEGMPRTAGATEAKPKGGSMRRLE